MVISKTISRSKFSKFSKDPIFQKQNPAADSTEDSISTDQLDVLSGYEYNVLL